MQHPKGIRTLGCCIHSLTHSVLPPARCIHDSTASEPHITEVSRGLVATITAAIATTPNVFFIVLSLLGWVHSPHYYRPGCHELITLADIGHHTSTLKAYPVTTTRVVSATSPRVLR